MTTAPATGSKAAGSKAAGSKAAGSTAAEFEAAGLYRPDAPDAPDRLALLEWLDGRGLTITEMQEAAANRTLPALAGDAMLRGEVTRTLRDIALQSGMDIPALEQMMRAAGFPPIDPDEKRYSEGDTDMFVLFAAASELFSSDEILHFTRVLGSAAGRVAEAANSLFLQDVERPLAQEGHGELALAQANLAAVGLANQIGPVMGALVRLHLRETNQRFRNAYRVGDGISVEMAIGFVDLCGFTAHSGDLSTDELALVVRAFEARAYDLVADLDGRVVKLIGDEVMFTAVDPARACAIVDALFAGFAGSELTPRAGIAFGPVLARGGDYYGPIVNLASRIADLAVPGEVLTTCEVADSVPGRSFVPAGRRLLKGFPEPIELVSFS